MSSTCMQGGMPRPLSGFEQNLITQRTSSPTPLWRYHPLVPKTEPVDYEDRNDSGINSSSPGSDNSENIPFSSPASDVIGRQIYANALDQQRQMYYARRSITPPSSKPMVSPRRQSNKTPNSTTDQPLPYPSPTVMENSTDFSQPQPSPNTEDPLQKLQMALENNTLLNSQFSPKPSENSIEDNKELNENSMDDMDAQSLRVPKVNSHGKVKKFKCKHCEFVAITKLDFWEHSKIHIKADKLLTCPQCPFVTEFKHHLEYHLRNHFGSKPFKCPMCKYCCVNKSMLNSHLKSHSNIYQYRCSDCNYATKYCHSLKIHSRKYEHEPATVLDPDGTPNPVCVVDVYGKRRGPKLKTQSHKQSPGMSPEPVLPFPINPMIFASPTMGLPFPGFLPPGLPTAITQALIQNLNLMTKDHMNHSSSQENTEESSISQSDTEALDLSKPEETVRNRRKGRAFKLTPAAESCSEDEDETTMFSNVEVVHEKEDQQKPVEVEEEVTKPEEDVSDNNNDSSKNFTCQYCSISFGDAVLYTIHMGQHGFKNPFCCNMCGVDCQNKIEFFLHIARHPHS